MVRCWVVFRNVISCDVVLHGWEVIESVVVGGWCGVRPGVLLWGRVWCAGGGLAWRGVVWSGLWLY